MAIAGMTGEESEWVIKPGLPFFIMDQLCRFWSCNSVFPMILPDLLTTCVTLFLCLAERLPYKETMLKVSTLSVSYL